MSDFDKVQEGDIIEFQLETRARYSTSERTGSGMKPTTRKLVVARKHPHRALLRGMKKVRDSYAYYDWRGDSLTSDKRDFDVMDWKVVGQVEGHKGLGGRTYYTNPDLEVMRDVIISPYLLGMPFFRLQLIDTGEVDHYGKSGIGYRLATYNPDGTLFDVVFKHEDHGIIWNPGVIDDDAAVGSVLQWLTLKPGDTDEEFFEDYTDEQLFFAEEHAENLALYGLEWSGDLDFEHYEGFEPPQDWPGDDAFEAL